MGIDIKYNTIPEDIICEDLTFATISKKGDVQAASVETDLDRIKYISSFL